MSDHRPDDTPTELELIDDNIGLTLELTALRKEKEGLEGEILFLLNLVPEWARNSELGLDPTMYGTGTYEGDRYVIVRIAAIRSRRAALSEQEERE